MIFKKGEQVPEWILKCSPQSEQKNLFFGVDVIVKRKFKNVCVMPVRKKDIDKSPIVIFKQKNTLIKKIELAGHPTYWCFDKINAINNKYICQDNIKGK